MKRIYEGLWPIDQEIARSPLLAKRYAEVFAGEPWKEVSRCDICQTFSASPLEARQLCTQPGCLGTFSEPAYPLAETQAYIGSEIERPQATGLVQLPVEDVRQTLEDIFAFGWGYPLTTPEFVESKYQTAEMQQILAEILVRVNAFFYISEVGVISEQQGKGIGTQITNRLAIQGKQDRQTVILRTNENSPMRYIAEKMGMKAVIGLRSGIRDLENQQRVIFLGR